MFTSSIISCIELDIFFLHNLFIPASPSPCPSPLLPLPPPLSLSPLSPSSPLSNIIYISCAIDVGQFDNSLYVI